LYLYLIASVEENGERSSAFDEGGSFLTTGSPSSGQKGLLSASFVDNAAGRGRPFTVVGPIALRSTILSPCAMVRDRTYAHPGAFECRLGLNEPLNR
jgi:hypothetical protein